MAYVSTGLHSDKIRARRTIDPLNPQQFITVDIGDATIYLSREEATELVTDLIAAMAVQP